MFLISFSFLFYFKYKLLDLIRKKGKIENIYSGIRVILDKEFQKEGFKQEDLIEALPTDESRFVYLDFAYENDDGITVYKIISILYCPMYVKAKKKMMYSTTYNSLNTALGGIQVEMQCDGPAELSREHILKKVKK